MTEQYYLVRLPLTDGQETSIRSELLEGPILDPAHMFVRLVGIIGAPIQPCADVETVGYGRETSFADLRERGCHAVSIHKAWDGGIPLVRRTDMEAQVARVVAEKDAEIARLRKALSDIDDHQEGWSGMDEFDMMDGYSEMKSMARAALNEGAAA